MSDPQDLKLRSHDVTDFPNRAPARAMLRAIGMTDDDWDKPQVGVVSSWNEVTPCNMPLDRLAKRSKDGVREAGGFPIGFNAIYAVSDGISMGHEGMRASLVSREVIADSVETVMHAERFGAMVTFAGCDKSLPGMMMAAARLNLPSVFLYGGSKLPGNYNGQVLDIVSVFEAVGAYRDGWHRGGRAPSHRGERLSHHRLVRRHVHRQHDGVGGRRPWRLAAGFGLGTGGRTAGVTTTATLRGRCGEPAAPEHPCPRHPDQGRVRERDRRGHGAGRLHQRGAAPARHRARGPRSSSIWTTSTRSPRRSRTWPTPSRTASTTCWTSIEWVACRSCCRC